MTISVGIDEAGRGPVIGPMVVAAVALDNKSARRLRALGVADSKDFAGADADEKRALLRDAVFAHALWVGTRVASVEEIDRRVGRGELNQLERDMALELLTGAPRADNVYADGEMVFGPLSSSVENMTVENKAESKYVSVAAASIVAKALRDDLFACIATRYRGVFGEIRGKGYENAATRRFLYAHVEKFGTLPPEARLSWPHNYLPQELRCALRRDWQPQLGLF